MVLELLKLLYQLVKAGFYYATELAPLCKPLLRMLDGRRDRTGVEGEKPEDRYRRRHTVKSASTEACDTLIVMECKLYAQHRLDLATSGCPRSLALPRLFSRSARGRWIVTSAGGCAGSSI